MDKPVRLLLTALLACLLSGCALDQRRRSRYVQSHPDLAPEIREAIVKGKLIGGMTRDDVAAARGRPTRSVSGYDAKTGPYVVWVYDYSYVLNTGPHDTYYAHPGMRSYYHDTLSISGTRVWFHNGQLERFEDY